LQEVLRTEQLHQPAPVQAGSATIVTAQRQLIVTLNAQIDQLGETPAMVVMYECVVYRPQGQ
jgi:hypothetical protein